MIETSSNGNVCPICLHEYATGEMNKHHLVPKSRKGKVTILVCRNCHRQVHALYAEKELERDFCAIELLLAADKLKPWIEWVRKRRPKGRIKTRTSKRKGR